MNPQIAEYIRSLLKIIGTIAITHGYIKTAAIINAEDTIGLVMSLIGFIWGLRSNTQKSILQKAADCLPPTMVLPPTTDSAPKATPMTPEGATDFIRKSQTLDTTAQPK